MNSLNLAILLLCSWSQMTATHTIGYLPDTLPEASGMARSHAYPGAIWLINDGDHQAALHLLQPGSGRPVRSWPVEGLANRDWEDLASFTRDSRHWLAIGDVGDNEGQRNQLTIGLIEEPAPSDTTANLGRRIELTLPGGPADIETLLYDPFADQLLLVTKRTRPPQVFAVALDADGGLHRAREIGPVAGMRLPDPYDRAADPDMGPWLGQPTAGDISPSGRLLALLTYDRIYLYTREPEQQWSTPLAQGPARIIDLVRLPQQEAVAFIDDMTLLLTSENLPAPLLSVSLDDD